MRKNILTIIIMAIVLINTILTAVLMFVIVPTSNKTNKLVMKVASIIDLELESPDAGKDIAVSDIEGYNLPEQLTINLRTEGDDDKAHYALVNVSLSINTKHEDYEELYPKIAQRQNEIEEIVSDEIGKYTMNDVKESKEKIREEVKKRIQELFKSDFIIGVSFGNIITQ